MPPKPAPPADDSDHDLALPADAPIWATLLQQSNKQASRDRREQAEAIRGLTDATMDGNRAASVRHFEVMGALREIKQAVAEVDGAVDAAAKAQPTGPFGAALAFVRESPAVKAALANAAVLLIGALTTYAVFRLTGAPSTPTPIQVAQPVAVEPVAADATTSPP